MPEAFGRKVYAEGEKEIGVFDTYIGEKEIWVRRRYVGGDLAKSLAHENAVVLMFMSVVFCVVRMKCFICVFHVSTVSPNFVHCVLSYMHRVMRDVGVCIFCCCVID